MDDKNEEVINELFGILDCHEHYYEARDEVFAFLINILTAERTKNPGVWDGAPEWARVCKIEYRNDIDPRFIFYTTYTRELSKTRAREIADETAKNCICRSLDHIAQEIESAILEYAESIK